MSKFIYKNMTPFKWFVLENFPFIEGDFEAINNYRLFSKVVEYLNEMKDNVNNFGQLLEEFSNYFDNLDVQDEINNKLDEMVEQGTLQEIIADYLNSKAIFGFDTVNDMKQATNLIDGSYAKTLGFYSKNDGGMATYKIRTITNDDVLDNITIIPIGENNLIAELIIENTMSPEMFGAKGNNQDDDFVFLNKMFSSNCKNIIMNNNYKVGSLLNIENKFIKGKGTIYFNEDTTGNIELINTFIDGINLIAPCTSNNIYHYVLSGNNFEIKNSLIEGIIGIYNARNKSIENINVNNCTIKGMYRDISLLGLVNNITIEKCKFSRDYNYTTPVTPDQHVYLYSNNTNSNIVDNNFINCRGSNITIKNCYFGKCAVGKRDLILINFNNITVDQIKTNNGEIIENGTDDILTFDMCNNINISNIDIDWSGENGIDILTCENVKISNCNINNCDYAPISLDHSDVGSVFGFNDNVNINNKNITINGCFLESTRACSLFITTAFSTSITECTLKNKYERNGGSFYGKLIQIAKNSTGGIIKSLKIKNNEYIYNSDNIQIWAYPSTNEQLTVFDGWNSEMEVDEKIGRVFVLENPNISSNANVLSVNLPLKRMKAYLLHEGIYYDVTGVIMIKRPGQTDNNIISRGGAYLVGHNSNLPYLNVNVGFGDYISNTPINNSNA